MGAALCVAAAGFSTGLIVLAALIQASLVRRRS
jgi:hypothetical protein